MLLRSLLIRVTTADEATSVTLEMLSLRFAMSRAWPGHGFWMMRHRFRTSDRSRVLEAAHLVRGSVERFIRCRFAKS